MDDQQYNQEFEKWTETIRSMIMHESNVVHQRMTWLMTTQSLLFASLGFAWDKAGTELLIVVLSFVGILSALSYYGAIKYAAEGMNKMIQWWDKRKPSSYVGPDIIGNRPSRTRVNFMSRYRRFLSPGRLLPIAFSMCWGIIIFANFFR